MFPTVKMGYNASFALEREWARSGQELENCLICAATSGVNDRRTRPAPGLFLVHPGAGRRHILNESTAELNSLNVLIQKKRESAFLF